MASIDARTFLFDHFCPMVVSKMLLRSNLSISSDNFKSYDSHCHCTKSVELAVRLRALVSHGSRNDKRLRAIILVCYGYGIV